MNKAIDTINYFNDIMGESDLREDDERFIKSICINKNDEDIIIPITEISIVKEIIENMDYKIIRCDINWIPVKKKMDIMNKLTTTEKEKYNNLYIILKMNEIRNNKVVSIALKSKNNIYLYTNSNYIR